MSRPNAMPFEFQGFHRLNSSNFQPPGAAMPIAHCAPLGAHFRGSEEREKMCNS